MELVGEGSRGWITGLSLSTLASRWLRLLLRSHRPQIHRPERGDVQLTGRAALDRTFRNPDKPLDGLPQGVGWALRLMPMLCGIYLHELIILRSRPAYCLSGSKEGIFVTFCIAKRGASTDHLVGAQQD